MQDNFLRKYIENAELGLSGDSAFLYDGDYNILFSFSFFSCSLNSKAELTYYSVFLLFHKKLCTNY